jgi:hypothetical protein
VGERHAHPLPYRRGSSRSTGFFRVGQAVEPGRCPSASHDDGRGPGRRLRTDTGHGHRTPDTGHRTPDTDTDTDTDTGHRTRGRWTRAPDTGRADSHARTLTEDADRAPKPPTPLGHRTMSLWAAHAALGNHDGSAVRPPCQCARLPTALPGSCSVAPPAANRRLGALLSCVGFGWYEGRAMALRKGEVCRVRLGGEC